MEEDPDPLLSLRARRRVLVALGYGAASAAMATILGVRPGSAGAIGRGNLARLSGVMDGVRAHILPAMPDAGPPPPRGHVYSVVIANGRVIDPETGFDDVANIGIDNGIITAVSREPLAGKAAIDARNKVVAPGFIDLLSYEPNPFGVWFKLADGVTTNLAMHGVSNYAKAFFSHYEGASPIHFGGAFHHHFIRGELGVGVEDPCTPAQLDALEASLRDNLADGFAAVSFSPEYSPGTTTDEMLRLARVAAGYGHAAFFHVRFSDPYPPGTSMDAIAEALAVARGSGAAIHIEHISSTGGTFVMADTLATLEQARASGVDVTACLYPYDYWGTFLASTRFAEGWQDRYHLTYSDLQVAGTTQRLTAATFGDALKLNKLVDALGSIPEPEVELALRRPWTMVASDAILEPELNNHPRATGTFCRLLGTYVRDLKVLDLRSALSKITIQPAQRVEKMIPALARKGRLQRGADADIVVFDPRTVADRATPARPALASTGVEWVVVGGQIALRQGEPQRRVLAGQALRSKLSG